MNSSKNISAVQASAARSLLAVAFWPALILILLQMVALGHAQGSFRFEFQQIRATVPVLSTNVTTFTAFPATNDTVILGSGATNAILDVAGLPPGAGVVLTDTNGNPLVNNTITNHEAVWVVLSTTNIAQGIYTFTLDAQGFDTNGLPVTNSMPFVLQSAHIWNGGGYGAAGFGTNYNFTNTASWVGGNAPGTNDDVVISDNGAQTNLTYASGVSFTNISITTNVTIGSLRFSQNTYADASSTNALNHTISMASGTTLSVLGSNGFSIMRDYINEFGSLYDSAPVINFEGIGNNVLTVSNPAANFGILVGNGVEPKLTLSTNFGTLLLNVNRVGLSDFEIYPNYRALNNAFNGGNNADQYHAYPTRMWDNFYLARTNYITAHYVDPYNYTNNLSRNYALTIGNNEQQGNGSSTTTFFYLGRTNVFNLDGIDFIGANSAGGNNAGTLFYPYSDKVSTNPTAYFRNVDGVSRMSIFSVSDDAGTNEGDSNVKSTVDFTYSGGTGNGNGPGSGYINLLVNNLFVARDRQMVSSNATPNVQGNLIIGNCAVNVNAMYLGDQECSNKVDWTTLYGYPAYLGYCQGYLFLTNNGYVPSNINVNGNITLGYTADNNPPGSAQQYNTYGQITIYSNVTLMASNIICDGGLNFYNGSGRQNVININRGGTLIVTNTIGYPNAGAADFSAADPNGIYLDALNMTAGKLGIFANAGSVSVYTRTFAAGGVIPSVIKVLGLSGVSSFPAQFPVISYLNASSPFINADVSSLGAGYYGYVLNDADNNQVDLYITTSAPNNLIWTGAANNNWDTTSVNWVTASGNVPTNFNIGDVVTFNDSSTVTNINIVGSVVPSQTGTGMTISNNVNQYTFLNSGTIAGTALLVKQGTNSVVFNAIEQGPFQITAGSLTGNGTLGTVTISTNVVFNYSGQIAGGLSSAGTVTFSGSEVGPIAITGGTLDNFGNMSTTVGQSVTQSAGTSITNEFGAVITEGTTPDSGSSPVWDVPHGSVLANFGTIYDPQSKISVEGLLYGTGTIDDNNGRGFASYTDSNAPRVLVNTLGVLAVNPTPSEPLGDIVLELRLDFDTDLQGSQGQGSGISTIRVDVDFTNPAVNDVIACDRWNNDNGFLLMTNINPSGGSFANGQTFLVFSNNIYFPGQNFVDTGNYAPLMEPYIPGPGLAWGLSNFTDYGYVSVVKSPNVWDGVVSTNWTTNSSDVSWKTSASFSDNQGAVFDNTASGSTTVFLNGNVAPDGYLTWNVTNIVVGVSTNITTFTNLPAFTPGIVVNNDASHNYVFTGPGHIRGDTGLYKTGPGQLTLLTSNDFFGNTIVDGGTLTISNYPGQVNIVSLGIQQGGQNNGGVILDGATLDYAGLANVNLSPGKGQEVFLQPGGGTIQVDSATNALALNKNICGPGTLTKTGAGTLILENAALAGDFYLGGTIINAGAVDLTAAAIGTGPLTINNSGVLELTNTLLVVTNTINIAGPSTVIQALTATTNTFSGPLIGSGTVNIINSGVMAFSADMSGFSGNLSLGNSTGILQFNSATNSNLCLGSSAASFNLGTGSAKLDNFSGSNVTYNLGALSGGANTVLTGRATNSIVIPGTTYSIGGANVATTTFSGTISNGYDTVSIIKVGSGALLLNGSSTYTGPTTVSAGTLGGNGTIASPLTVGPSGTLAPGAASGSIGTFTVNNTINLQGNVILKLNQANSPNPNDEIVASGAITGGGSLLVNNIGGTITNGATFQLFNKAVTGLAVTLPGGGYVWNNNIAANGSITLTSGGVSSVNMSPVSISTSLSGKTLTLSWPSDHIGWQLEAQTNALNIGINKNNWYVIPGSGSVTSVPVSIDTTQPTVFYRLIP